ncbi:major histocompatibility complex class I-related gene protein-like [Tiliqua scincoides]|uniref:major histocompatibility complex class I-related gene protein-like n=1 Tax=Tiliqua scincoides TaxID=71010 RepID=UPI003462EF9D
MGPRSPRDAPLLLLLLLLLGTCSGSLSHSLRYFYTGISEPGPELPWFIAVGYVDGQQFFHYDSNKRNATTPVPWMEKASQEDRHYWDQQTQFMQGAEVTFKGNLAAARNYHNQTGGFHSLQFMSHCELNGDGPSGGSYQYGYDGTDFIALDKETLSWTAANAAAQISKRKLEAETAIARHQKAYLEKTCIEWLQKYLRYGRETLLRKEPPTIKVTRKDSQQGLETLLCQAHGFYPKEIDVTWRKDGEVRQEDTFHGVVSPNPDGTYYTWLSIEIDPKERSHYRCHVEHDGLQDPLDVAVKESVPDLLIIMVIASVILTVLVLIVAGVTFYIKKRSEKAAAASDWESNSSADSLISSQCVKEKEK